MANARRKRTTSAGSAIKFRSKFEETVYENALRNKKELEYESLRLDYVIRSCYTPDFILPNGIVVECKGRLTAIDRRKMLAVRDANRGLDIRFVFMVANNPLRKGSKMKYWQWAEKHGFQWAEGTIPLDWWKENP